MLPAAFGRIFCPVLFADKADCSQYNICIPGSVQSFCTRILGRAGVQSLCPLESRPGADSCSGCFRFGICGALQCDEQLSPEQSVQRRFPHGNVSGKKRDYAQLYGRKASEQSSRRCSLHKRCAQIQGLQLRLHRQTPRGFPDKERP